MATRLHSMLCFSLLEAEVLSEIPSSVSMELVPLLISFLVSSLERLVRYRPEQETKAVPYLEYIRGFLMGLSNLTAVETL